MRLKNWVRPWGGNLGIPRTFSFEHVAIGLVFLFAFLTQGCHQSQQAEVSSFAVPRTDERPSFDTALAIHWNNQILRLRIVNSTFLGGPERNYYGTEPPDSLEVLWRLRLGSGETRINSKEKETWSGAGWTGQPLLMYENDRLVLFQGAYDHHLKKIDADSGKLIWQFAYDDVLKGTGSLWLNATATRPEEQCMILQGSRFGVNFGASFVPSFRAVSCLSGEELWRLNVTRTKSYSRDVDASALIFRDTAYIGLENGLFISFNPDPRKSTPLDTVNEPLIYTQDTLYTASDNKSHGGNLVTEASPSRIGNHLYVSSGSGHVFGYNLDTRSIDWDFFTGSDLDGSPVVTSDSCLLIAVEKQHIKGPGGVLKLDPSKSPDQAIVWYFPTGDQKFAKWEGGVIGSVAVNDRYRKPNDPRLAAFVGIDGWLNVVQYDRMRGDSAVIFDNKRELPVPLNVFHYKTGPSISTPLFFEDRIIVASYKGVYMFKMDTYGNFRLVYFYKGTFESTPVVHKKRMYLASRDGYLYCFGDDPNGGGLKFKKSEEKSKEKSEESRVKSGKGGKVKSGESKVKSEKSKAAVDKKKAPAKKPAEKKPAAKVEKKPAAKAVPGKK